MKTYPSIRREIRNTPIYAFDKLDGSNIRVEWTRKRGFSKYGSRKCLIDSGHEFLGESIELFQEKYERDLHDIFKKERYEKSTCFFEFYGENSFAGRHEDEKHTVTLIDVAPYKKGILEPREFLRLFDSLEIPKLLYRGNANQDFVSLVRERKLEGMTFEGVVCKAKSGRTPMPLMFKIKSNDWIQRLRDFCRGDDKLFQELL